MNDRSSHKSAPQAPSESTAAGVPPSAEGSGSHRSGGSGSSQGQLTVISARQPTGGINLTPTPGRLDTSGLGEGDQLGQFLLQKFIGGGGMGVVFRALDTTLNREVAVKVLSRDQSADDEALRRFRNEAQSAARLNHENIARVHYVGEDRGVHYIVFEFIEGINLRDRVEQIGPLPLGEAVSYTYQITQALDHASQRDVIHRDIKPSNVLITPDGKAKLVDMGLARLNQVAHADNDLTASGVTLGTFDYISPEQARDPRSADVRSDMYSLGCSVFYMLTGQPPFPDGTVLQKLLQHQGDTPPDPRTIRPELPVEITWLLARMLAKNPAQRFQLPSELADELAKLSQKLGLPLIAPPTGRSVPRNDGPLARWRHHLPWIVPVAALFLIVLTLDAIWSAGSAPGRLGAADRQGATSRVARAPNEPPPKTTLPPPAAKASNTIAPKSEPPTASGAPLPARPTTTDSPDPAVSDSPEETALPPQSDAPVATDQSPSAANPALERVAKTLGAILDIEALAARASAADDSGAQLGPPPVGAPADTLPAADPSRGADLPRPPAVDKPPAIARAPLAEGLLVVSDTQTGDLCYASLRAACNNAKHGDVIELRFSRRMLEEPITISNMTLTIRAGDGFRPIVVFRPEANPVKFPPSMLSVAGGQLHCEDVHWELELPRELAREWSLFETRMAERLRFERCTFTIRYASTGGKAYHAGVAFFDIKAPPGGSTMTMPAAADQQSVAIDLRNCVARGEATFVRDNDLQALRLDWENGLLATSERLLLAAGGAIEPRQLGYVQINLRHVTAIAQSGLALITNSEDAPYQMKTEFDCTDSIFVTTADPPLLEQRGSNSAAEYRTRVRWSGERQYFDGFNVFWKIVTGQAQTTAEQMDFDAWQETWAGHARLMSHTPIAWKKSPAADRPFSQHSPQDYALDDASDNLLIRGASDGQDAGCIAWQLSTLPPEPTDGEENPPQNSAPPRPLDGS
ncbi:MAG: protein kinase [Pirellulales bacterium]